VPETVMSTITALISAMSALISIRERLRGHDG
jgi:hypothetical protein